MSNPFYLTTPLYYVNGDPHVGHVYTSVLADTIARYKRFCGFDVCALTGTDEHGLKIERAAQEQGLAPKALTDKYSEAFREAWKKLDLRFDEFIRTTDEKHSRAVTEIFRRIAEGGFIYLGEYSGNYCVSCEAYVPEGETNCPDCGRPTEVMTEKSYFFKLAAFEDKLLEFYRDNPDFVIPSVRMNEIVSFVKGGLRDLSISRTSFGWGIPFPEDPAHIFYVWFDALIGYLSGVGFASDPEKFHLRWPADVQLIGKDILRFHAVYWPAFLMAAGLEPPRHILVNGWWTVGGEKMSKSRKNFIAADDLSEQFPTDYIKYFLLREIPVGSDGDFSFEALAQRVNSDLANDIGNLSSRTLKMIENYFDGVVPEPGEVTGRDEELIQFSRETAQLFRGNFDRYQIGRALENVWELISAANRYIVSNEPWVLAKNPAMRERLASVLYHSAEVLRIISLMLGPVVPRGTASILGQLGISTPLEDQRVKSLAWGALKPGTRIGEVRPVFPRLEGDSAGVSRAGGDEKDGAGKVKRSPRSARQAPPAIPSAASDPIDIGQFGQVDMRVGRVLQAERIPKSSKLLKLMVDVGFEVRQVVAGIGEAYEPEALPGRLVVVVVNLKPAKLMGVESNGMIVAATTEGEPVLATFAEDVPVGSRLK